MTFIDEDISVKLLTVQETLVVLSIIMVQELEI